MDSEELVFLAVKRWYNEQPEERSENFHEVGLEFVCNFSTSSTPIFSIQRSLFSGNANDTVTIDRSVFPI